MSRSGTSDYLAFDLGAESGRVMQASLHAGVLTLAEVCRFPNGPTRDNGSLRWDIHRVWREMQGALNQVGVTRFASIGVDAWGCDYGLLRRDGSLVEAPYAYRDRRTDGVMERVFEVVPRERIYETTGIQFLWFNTLYQLYAACQASPQTIAAADRFGNHSRRTQPLALRAALRGVHQRHDDAVYRRGQTHLGHGSPQRARHPNAAAS